MRPREIHSIPDRRRVLRWMATLPGVGLAVEILVPAVRFVSGLEEPEPDEVELAPEEVAVLGALEPNRTVPFRWGPLPGILLKTEGGELRAFIAVCTHADCNVGYRPDVKRFFCACHDGWYEADGTNVPGTPPPQPLRRLDVSVQRDGGRLIAVRVLRPGREHAGG